MKKISLLLIFMYVALNVVAQQVPLYTQYMLNEYIVNPAAGGKNDFFEAKSNNRYQWKGITDAPRTYILSVNGPLRSRKVGLGGYLFTDITGPTRRTGIYASYAYHLKINEQVKLGLGLSAGLLQFTVDGSKIKLHDDADVALDNSLQSVILPDFGFGLNLYSKQFTLGFSAPQLVQNKLDLYESTNSIASKLEDHYFINGAYRIRPTEDFEIEPSFMVKVLKPVPTQIDAGLKVMYKEMIWIGGAYRSKDAYSAMLGLCIQKHLTFAYAHDFTFSNLKNYSSGTHEILVGLKFIKPPKAKSVE
ncbi:MAG: type IX secretion system membrane protein PorP/SprF [Bacteroidetes bacterium]|nr:type IX secretion system membrane protein PorP/SprF [Bacteroidota bacterium]